MMSQKNVAYLCNYERRRITSERAFFHVGKDNELQVVHRELTEARSSLEIMSYLKTASPVFQQTLHAGCLLSKSQICGNKLKH